DAECRQQQQQLDAADSALASAVDKERLAQQEQLKAQQELDENEKYRDRTEAEIVKARALDAEINALAPQHRQQQQAAAQAGEKLRTAKDELGNTQKSQKDAEQRLVECEAWLQANAALARLSGEWPRWDTLFKQAKVSSSQRDAASLEMARMEKTLAEAQAAVAAAQAQVVAMQARVTEAEQSYEAALAAAGRFDAETLTRRHDQHRSRLEQLRQAEAVLKSLRQLTETHASHSSKQQQLTEQRQQQCEALRAVRETLPALIAADEQAAKMLDLAKLACSKNVETLRARLQADCECPVCGSRQHPFAVETHPFHQELAALETEVKACRDRRKLAEQQESRSSLAIEQIDKQCAELQSVLDALQAQIKAQKSLWESQTLAGDWAQLHEEQIALSLGEQLQAEEKALHTVSENLTAMSAALIARDKARQALDNLVSRQQAAQKQLDQTVSAVRAEEGERKNADEKQRALTHQLQQQLDDLDAAFENSEWRQAWQGDQDGFYRRSRQQAEAWQTRQSLRDQLTQQIIVLQTALSGLEGNIKQAEAHAVAADAAFAALDAQLTDKRNQRQGLLKGRAASEVEAELEQGAAKAKAGLQTAIAAAHLAITQVAAEREKMNQLNSALIERQAQASAAERKLADWLQAFAQAQPLPLTRAQLRQHLQHDALWLNQERQALQNLDKALAQAQTILDERRQQSEQHLQGRTSLETLENLQARLEDLTKTLTTINQQKSEVELRLRADDERLKASADLQARISEQAKVSETWSKLNSLIGSADGKRFRNIAQQLTLDILLGYANQHLKDLSRRYRLERVADTLALQVVDQDMGDDIRSVHSLSGGESFLLSLALALGLASLSSNRVRVESLFIDEGFGSLDADTLRVAMDALDSLQALGRKVGVISHVQEMTERIGTRIEVRRVNSGQSQITIG
ncbi:MAG: SbcC/MukB-like Walker B domain-containing protein, partial [Gammaproteobacteria bacterium]